jgi:hypothetical protein
MFYRNGALLATDTASPFGTTWTPPSAATYIVAMTAEDMLGNKTTVKFYIKAQ